MIPSKPPWAGWADRADLADIDAELAHERPGVQPDRGRELGLHDVVRRDAGDLFSRQPDVARGRQERGDEEEAGKPRAAGDHLPPPIKKGTSKALSESCVDRAPATIALPGRPSAPGSMPAGTTVATPLAIPPATGPE